MAFIAALASCTPKLAPTISHIHDSTTTVSADTNTTVTVDSSKIAPIVIYDTINFSTFCDSLLKGLMPTITTEKVVIRTDKKGLALLEAKTDSLIQFTKFQQTLINRLQNTVVHDSVVVTKPQYIDKPKTTFQSIKDLWFWISLAFIGGALYFKLRK